MVNKDIHQNSIKEYESVAKWRFDISIIGNNLTKTYFANNFIDATFCLYDMKFRSFVRRTAMDIFSANH